jgi:hypothetical protein
VHVGFAGALEQVGSLGNPAGSVYQDQDDVLCAGIYGDLLLDTRTTQLAPQIATHRIEHSRVVPLTATVHRRQDPAQPIPRHDRDDRITLVSRAVHDPSPFV